MAVALTSVLLALRPLHPRDSDPAAAPTGSIRREFSIEVAGRRLNLTRPSPRDCPCANATLCAAIRTGPRQEVYGFTMAEANSTNYEGYDWGVLTTVAWVRSSEVMCKAHSHGARAVLSASGWDIDNVTDAGFRAEWIQGHVQKALDEFLDGTNFDFEGPLNPGDPRVAGYTALVRETKEAFAKAIPGSQVTVDVAWSPDGIDGRFFDFVGLAEASDFLFVMAYDTRSQIFGPCVAAANSPLALDKHGLASFLALGIPSSKLVLGLPWYGYTYPCEGDPSSNGGFCRIKSVPFRGVNCSDAAGTEINFYTIMQMLNSTSASSRMWDDNMASPFFNYKEPGADEIHQIWYDDVASLRMKYDLASSLGLRGVGFWNLDTLDYSGDPAGSADTRYMWNAVREFLASVK